MRYGILLVIAVTIVTTGCRKSHGSEKMIDKWEGTWNIDSVAIDSTNMIDTEYNEDALFPQKKWNYASVAYRNYGHFTIDENGSGTLVLNTVDWNDSTSAPAKFNFYTIDYGAPYYAFADMLILECDTTKYLVNSPGCDGSLFKFFMEDDGKKSRVVRMDGSNNECIFPPFYDISGFREHYWFLSRK